MSEAGATNGRRRLILVGVLIVALLGGGAALANAVISGGSSGQPTAIPTLPTASAAPVADPTAEPTPSPSARPSRTPTKGPTKKPTSKPPTKTPTTTKPPVPGPRAPWISRVATTAPVAFITIDDGWEKGPDFLATLQELQVPVTLFLTINAISDNPDYFKGFQAAGAVIEAHTINHAEMKGMSYADQKNQICGSADQLAQWFGRRPIFFRPPYGDKDDNTLRAAHDCGMQAGFMWRETVDKGKVRYQIGKAVQPGDIILMHFRPAFKEDLTAAVKAIRDAGLEPALLEDFVK